MCLWVVCVVGQSVGGDDRVWLGGSLVPRVRGVVGVVYRIVGVCVGVVLGPDRLVRGLVLMVGISVQVGRLWGLGSVVVTSVWVLVCVCV